MQWCAVNTDRRLRVAVSGNRGLVGTALTRELIRRGHEIVALARFESDCAISAMTFAGCDALVNCAAANVQAYSEAGWFTNALLPGHLFSAAHEAGVAHFAHIGTVKAVAVAVAADASKQAAKHGDFYAVSKAHAESQLAAAASVPQSSKLTILRPAPILGPTYRGRLGSFVRAAKIGLPLPLGDFTARRSVVSVYNVAAAIAMVLEQGGEGGEYTLSDHRPYTMPELYDSLCAGFGRSRRSFALGGLGKALTNALGGHFGKLNADEIFAADEFANRYGPLPVTLDETTRLLTKDLDAQTRRAY